MRSTNQFDRTPKHILGWITLLFLTGCGSEVNVQIVDKPIDNRRLEVNVTAPQTEAPDIRSGAADLRWKIPADWQTTAPPRMVMARFVAPSQATLSISNFAGGGSDFANITRWAGQLGLSVTEDAVDSLRRSVNNPGLQINRYYLASDSRAFDIGVTRLHGTAWFFKLEGSPDAVASAQTGFNNFINTLAHEHGPAQASAPQETTPVQVSVNPGSSAPPPLPQTATSSNTMTPLPGMEQQVAEIAGARWSAPANWTAGPERAMRKGTYFLQGTAGQAELSITAFPGDVGGLAANINRWRNQIGLPPLDGETLRDQTMPKKVAGLESYIVWLQGESNSVLGAIIPRARDTWFFKATGPAATLEEHRQAFVDFLETVQF